MPSEPAPVYMKGGMAGGAPDATPIPPQRRDVRLTVKPGQSLRGIAHAYHVPERTIIAANHLSPPYKLKIGQALLVPGAVEAPVQQAMVPPPVHEAPLPVRPSPPTIAAAPLPQPVPLAPAPVAAAPTTPQPIHDIISLDDPPPKAIAFPDPPPAQRPAMPALPPVAAAPVQTPPPGPSAADEARAEEARQANAMHGGRFSWPVRGRVLAAYGVASGGAHNDGINIAAPKGAPIAAIDGGTVAYAGNELRGYGNLVLVKHPNGFISAYAHCEELLVKRGDAVHRGQVIAKVGSTGGVSEPQLHFELRRGKRAVDPREFLAPAPSAGTAARAG